MFNACFLCNSTFDAVSPVLSFVRPVLFCCWQVLAEPWEDSRVPAYLEKVSVRSAPIDVCLEDSLIPPLLQFLERAG